jgi:hypothetical protein
MPSVMLVGARSANGLPIKSATGCCRDCRVGRWKACRINANELAMAQSWQKSCQPTASMGPILHMRRRNADDRLAWAHQNLPGSKAILFKTAQRQSIPAAPMESSRATEAQLSAFFGGSFWAQFPHCCSTGRSFLLQQPTTPHAIQHRSLYIRRCA